MSLQIGKYPLGDTYFDIPEFVNLYKTREKFRKRLSKTNRSNYYNAFNAFLDFCGMSECKVKLLKLQRDVFCREEKELHRLPDTLPVYYDPKNPASSTFELTKPFTFSELLRAFALLAVIGFFGVLNYRRMKAKEAKQFVFQR